jgi:hypothetical protein
MRRGHVFQGRYKVVPVIASDSAGDGASWFSKPIRLGRQSGQYDAEIDQKYRKNVNPCTPLSSTTDSFEATLESYLWGWASFLRWVLSR